MNRITHTQYALSSTTYLLIGFKPTIVPHGNSKSSNPLYSTLPSTKERFCSECQTSGAKEVVMSLLLESWGIIDASYPGELPWDKQQVSRFKKKPKSGTPSSYGSAHMCMEANELYTIMPQAHLEDMDRKYTRDIKPTLSQQFCLLMIVRWMILPDCVVIHLNFVSLPSTILSV